MCVRHVSEMTDRIQQLCAEYCDLEAQRKALGIEPIGWTVKADPAPHPALDRLIRRLSLLIGTATTALEQDMAQVKQWQDEVSRQLTRYHPAAYLAGASTETLSNAARRAVAADLDIQLKFLSQFALEIQGADEWRAGWNARAEMYARSIQAPYWRGVTKLLPLPAMPGDGTSQCLTNCKCMWDVQQLDGDENYDCTWQVGAVEHCQTCRQRGAEWAPLRIRGGELQ